MKISTLMSFLVLSAACLPGIQAQDELAAAKALLNDKRYEAAIEKFDAILEKTPKLFAARLGIAQAYYRSGDPSSAVFHAVKAEKLQPKNLEAVELVGNAFSAVGSTKAANSTDPSADWTEAIQSFTKAKQLDPKAVRFPQFIGWLHAQMGQFEPAADAYLEASKLDPKQEKVFVTSAVNMLGQAGKPERAEAELDKALKKDPKWSSYLLLKGQIREKATDTKQATHFYLSALLGEGLQQQTINDAAGGIHRIYTAAGDLKGLVAQYGKWVKAKPESGDALWWEGFANLAANDFAAALESYKACEKVGGWLVPQALYRQGMAYAGLKKRDEALAKFKEAALYPGANWSNRLQSPVFEMRKMVGATVNESGFEAAIALLENWVLPSCTLPADKCEVNQDLGFFYRDLGIRHDPVSGDRGIPKDPKALKCFAKSRAHYSAAVTLLDQCKDTLTPFVHASILNDCGLMYQYYDDRDFDLAIKLYKRALDLIEDHDDSLLNWGLILIGQKKYDEAITLLERGSRGDVKRTLQRARRLKG